MKKLLVLIIAIFTIISISACSSNSSAGAFKVVDGKEVYMEGKNQVIDKLVEVDGEKYYIGDDGTKVKNNWAVIDNDGNYAYFGAKGQMIKNQIKEVDGDLYLLGDNGILKTNGIYEFDNNKYYATNDGKLLKESIKTIDGKDMYFNSEGKLENKTGWVESKAGDYSAGTYYLDNGGQVLKNTTTPDGKKVDANGKEIIETVKQVANAVADVSNSIGGLGSGITDVIVGNALGDLTDALTSNREKGNEHGLWIERNERKQFDIDFSWTSDDGEVETNGIKVIFDMPIVGGTDSEEIETYNKQIENITEQYIEDLKNCEPRFYYQYQVSGENKSHINNGALTSIKFLGSDQYIVFGKFVMNHDGDAAISLKMQYEYKTEKGKNSSGETINMHEFSFDRKNKQVTFYVDCGWEYINPWYILSKAYVAE